MRAYVVTVAVYTRPIYSRPPDTVQEHRWRRDEVCVWGGGGGG